MLKQVLKIFKHVRRQLKYFLILSPVIILGSFLQAQNRKSPEDRREIRVSCRNPRVNKWKIQQLFRKIDFLVRFLANDKKSQQDNCSVILVDREVLDNIEIISVKGNDLRLYLSEKHRSWEKDDQVLAQAVSAMLLQNYRIQADQHYHQVPRWLSTGLLRNLRNRLDRKKIPGVSTYPGIHALFREGLSVDLWKIIQYPLSPEDGPAYQLYTEACEILLDAILKLPKGKEILKDLVYTAAKGISDEMAFQTVLGKTPPLTNEVFPEVGIRRRLKDWYIKSAYRASINIFKPAGAKFAELQFRQAEKIEYTAKPGENAKAPEKTEQRFCLLGELGEKWPEIKDPLLLVTEQENKFTKLYHAVPTVLHPSIIKIFAALKKLKSGDPDDFTTGYAVARKEFYQQLNRLIAIEEYLATAERQFISPAQRYVEELKVIRRGRQQQEQIWPQLDELLAKEEWEFIKN